MCRQRREPSGGSVAGKKITVGRASTTIGPELERALDRMISTTYAEVKREVEAIAADVTENARDNWYDNVQERTGKTRAGIDYEMRLTPTSLRGVVFSSNQATYMVRRRGPLSKLGRGVYAEEFAEVMRVFRATGKVPEGYAFARVTRTRRPVGVIKLEPDGKYPRDGKNVWKVLVLDYGKRIIRERLDDIDRALQAVARRVAA